jgi:hypothetical protein
MPEEMPASANSRFVIGLIISPCRARRAYS